MRNFIVMALAFTLVFTAAVPLKAQLAGGGISGIVTDPSGARITGAEISIENMGTREVRRIATSSSGLYTVANLPPATYQITATAPGFAHLVRANLVVSVASEMVVNLKLQIGNATEMVEVVAESPLVDQANSYDGAVADGRTVRELPLNGRDWTSLASLQPGVAVVRTQGAPALSIVRANRGLGTDITVGGNRPQQNNYRLDGVSVNDYAGGGPASVLGVSLGVDAVQEFSVVTGNASADYGKSSGGVINAVTRAGTNGLHGSAFEFIRNSALDARNFFDTTSSPPPFKRNQFGGSVGGPVRHDKTFFFFSYEGLRQSLGVTNVDTVPSAAARAGQLQAGNVNIDSKVAPYLKLFPLPNGIVKGDIGQYIVATQLVTPENFYTARVDHHFSDRDSIHGTFVFDNGQTTGPDAFNDTLLGTTSGRRTATVEESHVFSPSVINFARIGFNRAIAEQVKTFSAINPAVADPTLGFLPGRPVGQINIAGVTLFQGGLGAIGEYHFHYNSYQAYDDLAWTKGSHSLKFGAGVEAIQSNALAGGSPNGQATFGSIAGFLQNQPTAFAANLPGTDVPLGMRQSVFGAYVQDDWRIRQNLTLNLGLRYEMATVPTEQFGRLATLPSLTAPQLKFGSPYFQNPTLRDFSPRVGLAWDPFGNGKTAVRAGFGIYDALPLTYEFNLVSILGQPYLEQGSSATLAKGSFPDQLYNTISASPTSLRTAYIEQNPKRNYVLQWNLSVQRQLASNLVGEIGYAGSHGIHSPFVSTDINIVQPNATSQGYVWPVGGARLNPNVGAITPVIWQISSVYDALRARLLKRLSHGLQVQASYTWSKSLDTGSNSFQTAFTNSVASLPLFDPHIRRSLSDFDIRHVFVLNGIWEVPGAHTNFKPASWLTHGWQLGGIWQVASGLPFTPVIAGDPLGTKSSNPFDFPDRLNTAGCSHPVNPGNPSSYLKLSCFAAPIPGNRLGNAGRNVAIGPGLFDLDTSLFKNNLIKSISETFNVQFRAEIFNILNRSNFNPPVATSLQVFSQALTPIAAAGSLTTTSTTSRQIQFAIKIIW
jgi:hypothetical protein